MGTGIGDSGRGASLGKELCANEEQFDFQSVYYCGESAGVRYTPVTSPSVYFEQASLIAALAER